MEPASVIAVLSAALAGGAVASEIRHAWHADPPIWVRTVWRSGSAEATELLSRGALFEAGPLFDLLLATWEADLASGQYRAIVLVDLSGVEPRHVVVRARRNGSDWVLDAIFGSGMNRAPEDLVRQAKTMLEALSAREGPVPEPVRTGPVLRIAEDAGTSEFDLDPELDPERERELAWTP